MILSALWGVAQADVYRWVDDHGEAHYTDRWVPGSELIKSSRPHPSTDSSAPAQTQAKNPSSANQTPAAKQEKANEAAVKQDVEKTKAVQCKQATERYQKAIAARRLYKSGNGDDRVWMSDEEADKYRVDARNDATLACGSPPAPVQPAE